MWTSGQADTIEDLYNAMDTALLTVGWIKHPFDTYSNMYEGVGGGTDKIYIILDAHRYTTPIEGVDSSKLHARMTIDSAVGYDPNLGAFEQPGSLQQWYKFTGKDDAMVDIPEFCVTPNERFFYWIFCDTYRIIVVCRMSIVYESMYLGFINPIASERQYPYPMYVCGNTHASGANWPNNQNGSFVFPQNRTGFLRRADGTWRIFNASKPNPSPSSDGTVFPYNAHNQRLIPNYKESDAINQDNFLLIPVMLQTNNPVDVNGLLRGCHWVSGTRDIDSERILAYGANQYIVFDTKQDRGANTYFAVLMA